MVAVLGVVVLIVAVLALQNPKGTVSKAASSTSSAARTSASAPKTRSASSVPTSSAASRATTSASTGAAGTRSRLPLVVLNNSTTTGLAKQAAQEFEAAGWSVTDTGNLTNDIISTCAYYDPADSSALAAAEALQQQFPGIKRIKPKFAELPSGPIVVVLTSDFTLG